MLSYLVQFCFVSIVMFLQSNYNLISFWWIPVIYHVMFFQAEGLVLAHLPGCLSTSAEMEIKCCTGSGHVDNFQMEKSLSTDDLCSNQLNFSDRCGD